MQAEESARRLEGEVAGARTRLNQLDGALRGKAKRIEQLERQLEESNANGLLSSAFKSRCGGCLEARGSTPCTRNLGRDAAPGCIGVPLPGQQRTACFIYLPAAGVMIAGLTRPLAA